MWIVPVVPGLAAVVLLCLGAWAYGYNPRWFSGRQAWYQAVQHPGQDLTLLATVALWAAAVGGFWWPRRHERLPINLVTVGVLVVLAAALGSAAYIPCRGQVSTVGVLFWVLQLYVGQPPGVYQDAAPKLPPQACLGPPPLGLQLGQLTGLGATLVTAAAVGAVLWHQPLQRLRLRLAREATVLTGLDALTLPLLRQLTRAVPARRVFVVEPDETHELLDEARATGARVIVGQLDWTQLLRPVIAGPGGCALRYLYALRGDITENSAVLTAAEDILSRHPPGARRLPQLVVRIDDPRHATSWRGSHGGRTALRLADALSPAETTAYALVDSILRTAARHLVICGDSSLTVALLAELDRRTWERHELDKAAAAGRRAPRAAEAVDVPWILLVDRVTLIDPKSADASREYQAGIPRPQAARQAAGRPSAELTTRAARWQDVLLGTLDDMSPAEARATAIVIVNSFAEADVQAAGRASRLYPHTAIFLETAAVDGITGPVFDQLHLFRLGLLVAGRVPEDTWTRVARHWHECYRLENPVPDGHPKAAARVPWDDLSPVLRQDNMLQVRSVWSAVSSQLDREWVPVREALPGSFVELGDSELDRVAEAEHERWYKQRLELGLANDLTVPWSELSPERRRQSREDVRKQVIQLEKVGFVPVIPAGGPAGARSFERVGLVVARKLRAPFRWLARSGEELEGRAGDWHVSDSRGAVRTVGDAEFQAGHQRVDRRHWRRVGRVRAWQATEVLVIRSKEGTVRAQPGDWVVEGPAGERWPVSDDQFQPTYRLARDAGASLPDSRRGQEE